MDSSLNRAHQWSRKADALSAAGKYDEAIVCHNRAAENVLETLQSPVLNDNASVLSCLRQQHEHHLRQVKMLQSQHWRQASLEARRGQSITTRNRAVQTTASALTKIGNRSLHDSIMINTQNIEESLRDADTLLTFLNRRKEDPKAPLLWETYSAEVTGGSAEVGLVAVKKPKDDKDIIEELRCLTGEFQVHIKQLVLETERLKAENQILTEKLTSHGESAVDDLLTPLTPLTLSSSFTLPPLEIPLPQPKMSSDSEDDLSDRL